MDTQVADFSGLLKERIAALVGAQRYKVWFKNATHFMRTDRFLKVGVPNQFIGGWIERHFADVIVQAAREMVQDDVELVFSVEPGLGINLQKKQLDSQAEIAAAGTRPLAFASPARAGRSEARVLKGRLETFVVGASNRMAFAAAKSIATLQPAAPHSLFVHGGCGLGKTHLLQGIANAIHENDQTTQRCAYLSGEEFTNEFLAALKNRQLDRFRARFRQLDVLLLDDVHFLANKKATQEEFLHTLNAIDTVGKRVVLASDAHPRMIGRVCEALISRFISGMVVRIETPDLSTRCDILRRRAAAMKETRGSDGVPDEVIQYVADRIRSNVRELEGALLRVVAYAAAAKVRVSLGAARQALEDHASRSEPLVTAERIESAVAMFFGMTTADLHTSRKSRTVALARSIAMYLARQKTALSFPEIGRLMGNKNHTTVLFACRRIGATLARDDEVKWQSAAGMKSGRLSTILRDLQSQLRK